MDDGTITTLRQCEHCAYFRQEESITGYCQFHGMYVLMDFDCGKFEQRRTRAEGGDGLAGSQFDRQKAKKKNTSVHDVSTE